MPRAVSPAGLASQMASDELYGLFDVRERGEYNARQIAGATSLPRSQIEFRVADLVPGLKIPLIAYDEGSERAALAARTLAGIGYENISVLEGGLPAWQGAGYATASGVNVPSKAFGEKVQRKRGIPDIAPEELKRMQEEASDLLILDVRTPEEYQRFCVPGGINVPGGDLVLWADALRRKPQTAVIVNCAGRTRSIIGAAALRRLGVANVRALRNGTMGWVLAGLELESKPAREAAAPPAESREQAEAIALRLAEEEKIPWIAAPDLRNVSRSDGGEVTYLIDVRSEAEYARGHVPKSINVPGGQAIQRADDFIAVRNGRIVCVGHRSARAVMAAYWYRQMGFRNVWVLAGGVRGWVNGGGRLALGGKRAEPAGYEAAKKTVHSVSPADVDRLAQSSSVSILDVGTSLDFEAAHLPGACWISRGWLELKLPELVPEKNRTIVVTCPDGRGSVLAARAMEEMGYRRVLVLEGGIGAWREAGYQTEKGLGPCLVEPNDVVLSPSIKGDKEEMRRYLNWELKLGS